MADKLPRAFEQLLARGLREKLESTGRHCPDTGTLAAYYERTLGESEAREWELHVSTCAPCQERLAAMVRLEVGEAPAADASEAPGFGWRRSWRWAAPLALAASAVLALTLTLQNRQALHEVSHVALTSEQPTAAALPTTEAEPTPAAPRMEEKPAEAVRPTPLPEAMMADAARPSEAPPPAASAPAPPAPPPLARKSMMASRGAAPSAEATSGEFAAAQTSRPSPAGAVLVPSAPDRRVVWRIGAAGAIERSNDGGTTWSDQRSGASVTLVAGSAPSATVCWVVGKQGTVLRTVDGRHWEKVTPPTTDDLARVTADEADTATVYSASGRRFVTNDGGRTWRSL